MVQWLPFKFVKQLYLAFVFQIIHVTSPYTQLGTSHTFFALLTYPLFVSSSFLFSSDFHLFYF